MSKQENMEEAQATFRKRMESIVVKLRKDIELNKKCNLEYVIITTSEAQDVVDFIGSFLY